MPLPNPMSCPRHGFTMMEALVAIALCGLLAVFMVPKLMSTQGNEQAAVLIQDTYTSIGELYLSREEDTSITTDPDIGGNERAVFGQYLRDHLRVRPPLPAAPADYCTASDHFTLQSGAIIRQICDDVPDTTPDTLQITIRIPSGANATDFILAIPEDGTSGASTGRYTTLFGITHNTDDCGFADRALKLTSDCS